MDLTQEALTQEALAQEALTQEALTWEVGLASHMDALCFSTY